MSLYITKSCLNMKNYISRPLYIRRIEPFIDKSIIKVITGQRRIGKSYILLQISDIIKKNIPEANIIFVDKSNYLHRNE